MVQPKYIEGYDNKYMIWPDGEVFSFKSKAFLKKHINKGGYNIVTLSKNNKAKSYLLHRLIAKYYIPNPENLGTVNHMDFNKTNNHWRNLEWCTIGDNLNHYRKGRYTEWRLALKCSKNPRKRKIIQYDCDGKFIKNWDSIISAAKSVGVTSGCIWHVLTKRTQTAGGYIWKYAEKE